MEHTLPINAREYRRGTQKWTTQRNWQHIYGTQDGKKTPKTHNIICYRHYHYNNVNKTSTNFVSSGVVFD
jgi:hypothetical protein